MKGLAKAPPRVDLGATWATWLEEPPQDREKTQQTPKDEAQEPLGQG